MIAPDETTFAYVKGRRPFAPDGAQWEEALQYWQTLASDPHARFDRVIQIDAVEMKPHVTWGTNPGMVAPVTGVVPDPGETTSDADRHAAQRALEYMALAPRTRIQDIHIDRVFIGSCTNCST